MNSSNGRVVVAGPNGTLGRPVIEHLVAQEFVVTLLTRNPDETAKQYQSPIRIAKANYDSAEELADVLRDGAFDSFVILINRNELDPQIKLIDAAIAAGVPHIIPSSFGIGTTAPEMRRVPTLHAKVQMEEYVVKKADEGKLSYTGVNTGIFFDWALERGLPVNLVGGPTFRADGGDVTLSCTTLDDIGKAVASAVLKRKEKEAHNKFIFVRSTVATQNQLLGYAREVAPDRDFAIVEVDTQKGAQEAEEKMRKGVTGPEVDRPMMFLISLGLGLGLFKDTANDFLSMPMMSEGEVKALVARYVDR